MNINDELLLNAILIDDNGNRIHDNKEITYSISNGEKIVSQKDNWASEYAFNQTGDYLINASLPNIKNVTVICAIVHIINDTGNGNGEIIITNNVTSSDDGVSNFTVGDVRSDNPLLFLMLMIILLLLFWVRNRCSYG